MLAGLALVAGEAHAQEAALLDSLLRANAHALEVTPEGLAGPGADFLGELADGLQFISLGESHNISEIPVFTIALLRTLRGAGFRHLALENGPEIVRMVAEAAREGGADAAFDVARRYPHGLQFWTDEEVALVAETVAEASRAGSGRIAGTTPEARTAPDVVWGLDQAWGALHILERLASLARTDEARALAAGLVAQARGVESMRAGWGAQERWIDTGEATAAMATLEAAFDAPAGSEAARLIGTLSLSNRIYTMRGGTGTYRSNDLRERTMKRIFMERYREAGAAGEAFPRVVAKFGHWHAGRGRSPGEVYSLGNFLSELAVANGLESFHISVALLGDVWTLEDYPEYDPLPRIGLETGGPDGWTLIDLRPLRAHLAAGLLPELSPELRDLALHFDAELLIGGARRGTRARLMDLDGRGPADPEAGAGAVPSADSLTHERRAPDSRGKPAPP